jgi:hypothetical protein
MSVFTMILDIACSNGYAIASTLSTKYKRSVHFREYKRRVSDQLTFLWRAVKEGKEQKRVRTISEPMSISGEPTSSAESLCFHILSDNDTRGDGYLKDGVCYLCTVMGIDKTGVTRSLPRWGASNAVSASTCDAST